MHLCVGGPPALALSRKGPQPLRRLLEAALGVTRAAVPTGKECDLNRQCGVINPETKKICTRLLTCKVSVIPTAPAGRVEVWSESQLKGQGGHTYMRERTWWGQWTGNGYCTLHPKGGFCPHKGVKQKPPNTHLPSLFACPGQRTPLSLTPAQLTPPPHSSALLYSRSTQYTSVGRSRAGPRTSMCLWQN